MSLKNELTSTLEAVREVAAAQGVDPGTILQCALLGVLDEINGKLGDIPAAMRHGDALAQKMVNRALEDLGKEGVDWPEDDSAAEDGGPQEELERLKKQIATVGSFLSDQIAGLTAQFRELRRAVDAHEICLETHAHALQDHEQRLNKAGTALHELTVLYNGHVEEHPAPSPQE